MLWRLRLARRYWQSRGAAPLPLQQCWESPLPTLRTPVTALRFLVCDGEMTGFDPRSDELLSLARVPVQGAEICLAGAVERRIRNTSGVGESAVVHRLRDCDLRAGRHLEEVLMEFVSAARGHILVFHHAALDIAFLESAVRRLWGVPLLLPVVDTLRLEERQLRRRDRVVTAGDLSLRACRARYGLPGHAAHSAIGDALAGAELFLAQVARRGPGVRLCDLL